MATFGNLWQSVAVSESFGQSMVVCGSLWQSVAIGCNLRQSVSVSVSQWQSVAVSGSQWPYILKVKKFAESAFQSQNICGKSA